MVRTFTADPSVLIGRSFSMVKAVLRATYACLRSAYLPRPAPPAPLLPARPHPALTWSKNAGMRDHEQYLASVAVQADTALRDLLERLLAKGPRERLTVPEARDHVWVRSWLERRCHQGSSACGGVVICGDGGETYVRGALLLAESSFSSSFSPGCSREDGGGSLSCGAGNRNSGDGEGGGGDTGVGAGVGGGGRGGGGWEHGGTFGRSSPRDRVGGGTRGFPTDLTASGRRVDVTDEDIRAAVTQAPGFVVVVSGR